jgi:hypothetical protein
LYSFWVSGDGDGAVRGGGSVWVKGCFGAVNKTIEVMALEEWLKETTPDQETGLSELWDRLGKVGK